MLYSMEDAVKRGIMRRVDRVVDPVKTPTKERTKINLTIDDECLSMASTPDKHDGKCFGVCGGGLLQDLDKAKPEEATDDEFVTIHRTCYEKITDATKCLIEKFWQTNDENKLLRETIQQQKERIAILNERIEIISDTVDSYRNTIDKQETIMSQARLRIEAYRDRMADNSEIAKLNTAKAKAERNKWKEEQEKNKELTSEITRLQKETKHMNAVNAKLRKEIEDMKTHTGPTQTRQTINSLQEENNTLRNQVVDAMAARDTQSKLQERVQQLQQALDSSEQKAQDFKRDASYMRSLYKQMKTTMEDRDEELASAKKELNDYLKQLEYTTDLYECEQQEHRTLSTKLETALSDLRKQEFKRREAETDTQIHRTRYEKVSEDKALILTAAINMYEAIKYQNNARLQEALSQFEEITGLAIVHKGDTAQ